MYVHYVQHSVMVQVKLGDLHVRKRLEIQEEK